MSMKINWVISYAMGGTPWAANPCAFITDVEMVSPNCLERPTGYKAAGWWHDSILGRAHGSGDMKEGTR